MTTYLKNYLDAPFSIQQTCDPCFFFSYFFFFFFRLRSLAYRVISVDFLWKWKTGHNCAWWKCFPVEFLLFSRTFPLNSDKILIHAIKTVSHRTCFLVKCFKISKNATRVFVLVKSELYKITVYSCAVLTATECQCTLAYRACRVGKEYRRLQTSRPALFSSGTRNH